VGEDRKSLPVRVRDTARERLIAQQVRVKMFDPTEPAAKTPR
jgi:hypothetical protein